LARLLIIAEETKEIKELAQGLSRAGFDFPIITGEEAETKLAENPPELVLWQTGGIDEPQAVADLFGEIPEERKPHIIALVAREKLAGFSPDLPFDDFIVSPFDAHELILRIKRLLGATGAAGEANGFIKAGDLVIDTAKAEILVKGHRVELTYREYELLRFLSSNPGRVFTREALLNRVWGYDYYGGDRTVDVHIRRLRSKIETDKLTFIETVRNIGYRFRDDLETTIV
jgi:DNA-binding response OmpR family regulator